MDGFYMGRAWIKATKHPFRQSQRSSLTEEKTKSNEARQASVSRKICHEESQYFAQIMYSQSS